MKIYSSIIQIPKKICTISEKLKNCIMMRYIKFVVHWPHHWNETSSPQLVSRRWCSHGDPIIAMRRLRHSSSTRRWCSPQVSLPGSPVPLPGRLVCHCTRRWRSSAKSTCPVGKGCYTEKQMLVVSLVADPKISNSIRTKDKRISKDKSPSVWFLFCDVLLDLSKYKQHEFLFNFCYKHALCCVMMKMVLDSYLLKKYFLALHNACVQFLGVTTVIISQFIIWNQTEYNFLHFN